MAIRIDDGAVLRMIVAQMESAMGGGDYTLRYFGDPINDAGNSPLVTLTRMDIGDQRRSQPNDSDQHDATLDLIVIGAVGEEQASAHAIGTVGATIAAALAEHNLVDGTDLGGSSSEHTITLGQCRRVYESVSVENREILTVTCTFADSTVIRRSGSSIASFLN